MRKLVILGGFGIGMIAASIAEQQGYEVVGFLNDNKETGELVGRFRKYPVIGSSGDIHQYIAREHDVFVAYVGLQSEMVTLQKVIDLDIPMKHLATLIHPTACYDESFCEIGHGVLMAPYVQLSTGVRISDQCILLGNSFVGHNSTLEYRAHLATNSVVGANVNIGTGVHIGSNATIREYVNIGSCALIGAGAVVLNDVPPNAVVVGNPAQILKQR